MDSFFLVALLDLDGTMGSAPVLSTASEFHNNSYYLDRIAPTLKHINYRNVSRRLCAKGESRPPKNILNARLVRVSRVILFVDFC